MKMGRVCMVLETKVFSKTFGKLRQVPLMPEGDDEIGKHLIKKWCTEESECVVFKNGLV